MPIVIPAAPGSTSALQSVPTQTVFDYLYDSQGNPRKGAPIVITLNVEAANSITPQVQLTNIVVQATTDNNGFWSVALIPNANISPANTTYSVQIPGIPPYQISIPSAGGPFQSTSPAVLVNTPGVLQPATSGITGNLTVSGNESVSGTLSVTGNTSLATTNTGVLTVGGDLTIASAFRLLMQAAVSKLVPGVTSFSLRDSTDSFDNLLVANNGDVTVRARLLLALAVARIVGGATSVSLRNNADSADNVLVTDAGLVTLRNALSIPPSAGGTPAASSYGSVGLKLAEATPSGVNSFTLMNPIPTTFRTLVIEGWAASTKAATFDGLFAVFNNDTASGNDVEHGQAFGSTVNAVEESLNGASAFVANIAAANAPANTASSFLMRIPGYASAQKKSWIGQYQTSTADTTGSHFASFVGGRFRSTTPITRIDFNLGSGNFQNAVFILRGEP